MKLSPLLTLLVVVVSGCEKGGSQSTRVQREPQSESRTLTTTSLSTSREIQPYDTESGQPMDARQALRKMELRDGFTATLFASEPMVRQPIDMKVDARGRVWIAEAYSYMAPFAMRQDRILVLEDTDGDGSADKQTVFAAGLDRLMSIELGFGGVWVLNPPELLFIADADGDLKPDAAPETHVRGWNTHGQWNMANGLVFGPDGWLYGREGQIGTSSPVSVKTGKRPGPISSGIWRYHPPSGKLEIVAQGMTNPWGLDWNADGELFASGNCNGHLWHIVGGSLFEWGFGAREFPSEYGRTPPIEDAPHYSPGKDWFTSWEERYLMQDANNAYGGGHSHCGLLICNGSSWPESMRGHTLMANTHGRRINEDAIEPNGATYVAHRIGDPVLPADPWFRGVSVVAAPDGAFFVSDWSDTGECHDKSGIHQQSGRVFRIVPKPVEAIGAIDRMTDAELVGLLRAEREEPARQALRELQHRARLERLDEATPAELGKLLAGPTATIRMRALCALHGGGLLTPGQLLAASKDPEESLRAMAVRYWAEREDSAGLSERFLKMAGTEPGPRALLHLASVTRLLPTALSQSLTAAILVRDEPPADRTLQLLWHIRIQDPSFHSGTARNLLKSCHNGTFASYLARYLVDNEGAGGFEAILEAAAHSDNPAPMVTAAVTVARENFGFLPAPADWPKLRKQWMESPDPAMRGAALSASILFGDRDALNALRARLRDAEAPLQQKVEALETLAAAQSDESIEVVGEAFRGTELRLPAIHAMRHFTEPSIAELLLQGWNRFDENERLAAVETLVTRKQWAMTLLAGIGEKTISKEYLSPAQASALAESGDPALRQAVLSGWGDPAKNAAQKEKTLARAKKLLDGGKPGEARAGRTVFTVRCGTCHVLYGDGGTLGPDLTSRNRADLPSLLRSIVDPSAEVPEDGRLSIVTRKDGSIASGIIASKNDTALVLRGIAGNVRVATDDIANVKTLDGSPMPEGLLDGLSDPELLDLFAYLRADQGAPPK